MHCPTIRRRRRPAGLTAAACFALLCVGSRAFMPSSPILTAPRPRLQAASGSQSSRPRSSVVARAATRQVPRMPSSEPQVPWKPPGSDQAMWVSVNQRLQRSRIIMIGRFIDDEYANQLIAMLLYLEKENRDKPVSLYFNSPGALLRPALSVYDTLMQMAFPITTLNLGLATGMVSFLCAAGDKGMRCALPNARFLMQRTGMEDAYRGQASDIAIEVANMVKANRKMEEALVRITGHSETKIHEDLQRDFYLSAAEAVQYGIIDKVLLPRDKMRAPKYKDLQFGIGSMDRTDDPSFGTFGGQEQRYGNVGGGGFGGAPTTRPGGDDPGTAGR